ncbi:MAG TPA: hypothetical protein VGG27_05410 [Magnetospirillaceae bacterium]|jgi:hypothetical protein
MEQTNNPTFRRLVTGIGPDGKSYLADDSRIAAGTLGNFNFWMMRRGDSQGGIETKPQAIPFYPKDGAVIFRIFRLPPSDPNLPAATWNVIASEFFASVGDPSSRADTSRHPLMHTTPTVDYIMLLDGRVSLLLDTGDPIPMQQYDVVVQRATNHTWVNTGSSPATLMAVMIGQKP